MKIFVTGTNTDIGKTYFTKHLFKLLQEMKYKVCIFKPFQTEEIEDGIYPDLETFRVECGLDYLITSLYKFRDPVSPHLAFKREMDQIFKKQKLLKKIQLLENDYDFILIEGAGGIAVPIYEYKDNFYMTTDLIKDVADSIISIVPSKLGAISDAIVHQFFINHMQLPKNILVLNNYSDTAIEKDNQETIEKKTKKIVYIFKKNGTFKDFSDEFIENLIGGEK